MTTPGGSDGQGWGPPSYGGFGAPSPYGGLAPTPGGAPPPSEVRTAFWLWVANMVTGVVAGVLSFATMGDAVRYQLEARVRADPSLNQADVETAIRVGIVVGALFALVFVALQLFFVFRMRSGRGWARTVLTVLGSLSVLLTLASLGAASTLDAGLGVVKSVLVLAAIVYMFTGSAREYFAPRPKC